MDEKALAIYAKVQKSKKQTKSMVVSIVKNINLEDLIQDYIDSRLKILLLNYFEKAPNETEWNVNMNRCWLNLQHINREELDFNKFDTVIYEVEYFLPNPQFIKHFKNTHFIFRIVDSSPPIQTSQFEKILGYPVSIIDYKK